MTRVLDRLTIRQAAYLMFYKERLMKPLIVAVAFVASLFAFAAGAYEFPYQTTLINYNHEKAPCLSSYRIVPITYALVPYASFLECGNGMLTDDPNQPTAFVTLKLRKDTVVEVRFPSRITTFTGNFCVGCTDAYNSVSKLLVSNDAGMHWKNMGALGPIISGPNPTAVAAKLGDQIRQRQSREASVTFDFPSDTFWVKGYETVVNTGAKEPVKWLPSIFFVYGN